MQMDCDYIVNDDGVPMTRDVLSQSQKDRCTVYENGKFIIDMDNENIDENNLHPDAGKYCFMRVDKDPTGVNTGDEFVCYEGKYIHDWTYVDDTIASKYGK